MKQINEITGLKKITPQLGPLNVSNHFARFDEKALKNYFIATANQVVMQTDPKNRYGVDEHNKQLIADMFAYFTGQQGNLYPNKGIWLQGDVGTGKTILLKIFSKFLAGFRMSFKIYSANDICQIFEKTGDLDLFMLNEKGFLERPVNLAIDEIGHEPIQSNHYGTKRNVIQYILHARYSLWQDIGLKTYVTTNLSMQDIYDRYGEAIEDRIAEMFNVIPVTGESRRT